jgi:formate hydrogenlyase subunit 6/NADH:ubiquinone oxidoreductase subunit I
MNLDKTKCVGCKKCEKVCPMAIEVTKNLDSPECIRCGKCKAVCQVEAISSGVMIKRDTNNELGEEGE